MVNLFDAASGARIGRITEAQLQALVGWMEEESTEDRDYYVSADALDMIVQRLVELYAETNQTGFIGRAECDGMPTLAEAFARVKLA